MKRRTVKIEANVELSDYVDVDVNLDDVIDEIQDDDLINEMSRRKISLSKSSKGNDALTKYSICDMFGVNYHTDNNQLKLLMNNYIDGL